MRKTIIFRGDPIPVALRQLAVAGLAGRALTRPVGYVWVTDRGADGYDVLGWDDEEQSERDDGAGATFRRVYPHEVERVPCRRFQPPGERNASRVPPFRRRPGRRTRLGRLKARPA